MQVSLVDLWAQMGALARAVVALLTVMSLVSLATAAERWLVLRRAAHASAQFLAAWRARRTEAGVAHAAEVAAAHPASPIARVVAAGSAVLAAGLPRDVRREAYDREVRRVALAAGSALRRGLGTLATVGATAPFVGLLGTVLGIVNAFAQLATSNQGGVGQVSSGIAEALVTTAFGIGVAIPAVWLYNHLTQQTRALVVEMECAAEELAVAALGESAEATPHPRIRANG
jgi:biopolymer transport protein ExbB/biopolymer transport protein TolQ